MKCSTILLVTSGALLVGVAAYSVYKYYQNQPQTKASTTSANGNEKKVVVPNVSKIYSDSDADEIIISEFQKTQAESSNSIKERHQTASHYMKETLEEMVADNEEFEGNIKQINEDLDDLLK